jgi:uncharacterized protein (DUF342 family)
MCSTYKSWGVKYCKNYNIEFDKILNEIRQILFTENKNCTSIKITLDILRQTLDSGKENRINTLTKQLEKYRKRLNNLTDLLLDDVISKAEYISKKEEFTTKITSLQSELEKESIQQTQFIGKEKRLQEIKTFLETSVSDSSDITDDDIRKFIKRITVFDEKILVETESGNSYNIDPDNVKLKFMPRNKEYLQKIRANNQEKV